MYQDYDYNNYSYLSPEERAAAKRNYFSRTYQTMAFGLLITFATALVTAMYFPWLAYNYMVVLLLCVAQIGLVVALNRAIATAGYGQVIAMFAGYACLTGVTFGSLFLLFDVTTIFQCFLATAAAFGGMAIFGAVTKRDLSPWISSLMGTLIGVLVLAVVNIFLQSPMLDSLICAVGVVLFMGMAAYDSQKLGQMFDQTGGGELAERYSVYAALQLYLDFINIFLYLLRLVSRSRRN
ncbi:MAG: Bax inhibitor-1/YccA family protein [Clostridiales bacterium]|nr:Bax inhibitor-1/YccA family protein [Clostridiales bacterium]MCD8367229.1 Bax inhibitor-1/YccA family protein [Clostridiales bacterium]